MLFNLLAGLLQLLGSRRGELLYARLPLLAKGLLILLHHRLLLKTACKPGLLLISGNIPGLQFNLLAGLTQLLSSRRGELLTAWLPLLGVRLLELLCHRLLECRSKPSLRLVSGNAGLLPLLPLTGLGLELRTWRHSCPPGKSGLLEAKLARLVLGSFPLGYLTGHLACQVSQVLQVLAGCIQHLLNLLQLTGSITLVLRNLLQLVSVVLLSLAHLIDYLANRI